VKQDHSVGVQALACFEMQISLILLQIDHLLKWRAMPRVHADKLKLELQLTQGPVTLPFEAAGLKQTRKHYW
jgi:hypothetical protein